MIGIIGAMDIEVEAILKLANDISEKEIFNIKFYVGKISNKDVVITKSGVGKTLAAMSTTLLINNFNISNVINIGSAGALKENINVFDVVVSERVALSDFDISAFGHKRSFDEDYLSFKSDENLLKLAKEITYKHVHFGDMTSSDSFISKQKQVADILDYFESSLCADMEAASIAMVLDKANIPFIVIRSISDNVVSSKDNALDFNEYLKVASKNSALITKELIEKM